MPFVAFVPFDHKEKKFMNGITKKKSNLPPRPPVKNDGKVYCGKPSRVSVHLDRGG